ncbi:MAG: ATP-binding protein [Acidobacteriota bacterium]|nr:ATP-binding protein [Acidobacteriota bacterium]
MPTFKNSRILYSVALSLSVALSVIFLGEIIINVFIYLSNFLPVEMLTLNLQGFFALLIIGVASGFITEKLSIKKILPYVGVFIVIWAALSFAAAKYFTINLYFARVFTIVVIAMVVGHIKKLWLIDYELTERLVQVASTEHLLQGKSADSRIESGLKLLETVLPLSEAIVFHYDESGELKPVGRARNDAAVNNLVSRQAEWRENIGLCEQAFQQRQTVVSLDENKVGSARAALPLIYEKVAVGVLFVKVDKNFEYADRNLLEAFSDQLARNFQRKELRRKSLPHKTWWSGLSTESAENRLDVISLINSSMMEHSFGALASSHLKEAHAIAYLDGTLAYLNRQMRHLSKMNAGKNSEVDLFGLLDGFKNEIFNEPSLAIRRVLQTGDHYNSELFYPETNKTLKIQITLVKVPNDDVSIHETNVSMKPACFLVTISDISAVKENERLRSDLTSLMSHELRTPVTSIQGFAELLLADENIPGESREFLEIICNESQRLSRMLSTFLSVSNLEQTDKQGIEKTPVKVDTVVSQVVTEMQEQAKRKRIRLVEQSNSHIPPVAADKSLIQRVVSHLVDNAIKYSPERTSILISTILEADFLRVVVEDRGYGIPTDEKEKIWQKFYRISRDGQDKEEESTGLGLSLVKEIIEQHGGQVGVESEIGQGSKFSFTLPRL